MKNSKNDFCARCNTSKEIKEKKPCSSQLDFILTKEQTFFSCSILPVPSVAVSWGKGNYRRMGKKNITACFTLLAVLGLHLFWRWKQAPYAVQEWDSNGEEMVRDSGDFPRALLFLCLQG